MKTNAPEKIYLEWKTVGDERYRIWGTRIITNNEPVEYIRKDAFIEKAKEFLSKESNIPLWEDRGGNFGCDTPKLVEKFINYMKGE